MIIMIHVRGEGHKGLKVIMIHARVGDQPLRFENHQNPSESWGLTTIRKESRPDQKLSLNLFNKIMPYIWPPHGHMVMFLQFCSGQHLCYESYNIP